MGPVIDASTGRRRTPARAYEDWLTKIIDIGTEEDTAYEAARGCIQPVKELRSIFRIAITYPENASKRARSIAARVAN